jgi:hypothetical protein
MSRKVTLLPELVEECRQRSYAGEGYRELQRWLLAEHGIKISHATVRNLILRLENSEIMVGAENLVTSVEAADELPPDLGDLDTEVPEPEQPEIAVEVPDEALVMLSRNRLAKASTSVWLDYRRKKITATEALGVELQVSKELRAIMVDRARLRNLEKTPVASQPSATPEPEQPKDEGLLQFN